jgi:hypothetical protein
MSEPERILVLTHEYSDKSGFSICGVTRNMAVAMAWCYGNFDNHVYALDMDVIFPATAGVKEIKL